MAGIECAYINRTAVFPWPNKIAYKAMINGTFPSQFPCEGIDQNIREWFRDPATETIVYDGLILPFYENENCALQFSLGMGERAFCR